MINVFTVAYIHVIISNKNYNIPLYNYDKLFSVSDNNIMEIEVHILIYSTLID